MTVKIFYRKEAWDICHQIIKNYSRNYAKMNKEPFNMKTARDISITKVLYDIGLEPVRVINESQWYLSPLRKERKPSFKVNTLLNRWYDFGEQVGGNIVDLVIQVYGFTPGEALKYLSKYNVSSSLSSFDQQKQSNQIELLDVKLIEHKALREYMSSRCVREDIYQEYCKEIHYRVRDKRYFAVGFENQSGGYELRSKFFKGCIGKKDISYLKNNSSRLLVFEGFIDYLSLLGHGENLKEDDTIVLNSVGNVRKIYSLLDNYSLTSLYLDNDEAGNKYTKNLLELAKRKISDLRHNYDGFKDLNEFLIQASLNNNK